MAHHNKKHASRPRPKKNENWEDLNANISPAGNIDHSDIDYTAGESREEISREMNTHSDETSFPKSRKDVWTEGE